MKYEMVESFFDDLADYMQFFLMLKETRRTTSDLSCVATLKKEDSKYLLRWWDFRSHTADGRQVQRNHPLHSLTGCISGRQQGAFVCDRSGSKQPTLSG